MPLTTDPEDQKAKKKEGEGEGEGEVKVEGEGSQMTGKTDPYGYKRLGVSDQNIRKWDKLQKSTRETIDRSLYSKDELANIDKLMASGYTETDAVNNISSDQAFHVNSLVDEYVMLDNLNKEYVTYNPKDIEKLITDDKTVDAAGKKVLFRAAGVLNNMQSSGFVIVRNKRDGRYWIEQKDGQGKNVINGIVEIATILKRYGGVTPPVIPKKDDPKSEQKKDDVITPAVLPKRSIVTPNTPSEITTIIDESKWEEWDDAYLNALWLDMGTSAMGLLAKGAALLSTAPTGGIGTVLGWLGGAVVSGLGGAGAAGLDAYGDYLNPNVSMNELYTNLGIRIGLEGTEMIAAAPVSLVARLGRGSKYLKMMKKIMDYGMMTAAVTQAQHTEWTEILNKEDWSIDDWTSVATMVTVLSGIAAGGMGKIASSRKIKGVNKKLTAQSEGFEGEIGSGMKKAKADGEIKTDFASGKKNKAALDASTEAVFNKSKTKKQIEIDQKNNAKKSIVEVDDVLHKKKTEARYNKYGDINKKNKAVSEKTRLKEKKLKEVSDKRTKTASDRINKTKDTDVKAHNTKIGMHQDNIDGFEVKKRRAKTQKSKDTWQRKINAEQQEIDFSTRSAVNAKSKAKTEIANLNTKHKKDLNKRAVKTSNKASKQKVDNVKQGKKELDKEYSDIQKTKKTERRKIYDSHNEKTKSSNKHKDDFKANVKKGQAKLQAKKKVGQAEGRAKKKVELVKKQQATRNKLNKKGNRQVLKHNDTFNSSGKRTEAKLSKESTKNTKTKVNAINERIAQIDTKLNNPKTKHNTSKKEMKALAKERADLQATSDRLYADLKSATGAVVEPRGKISQAIRNIIKKVPGAKTVHNKITKGKDAVVNSKAGKLVGKGAGAVAAGVEHADQSVFNRMNRTSMMRATARGSGLTNSQGSSAKEARGDLRALGFKFKPGDMSDSDILKLQNHYIKQGLIIKKGGKTLNVKPKYNRPKTKKEIQYEKNKKVGKKLPGGRFNNLDTDPIIKPTENLEGYIKFLIDSGEYEKALKELGELQMDDETRAHYEDMVIKSGQADDTFIANNPNFGVASVVPDPDPVIPGDVGDAEIVGKDQLGSKNPELEQQLIEAFNNKDYAAAKEIVALMDLTDGERIAYQTKVETLNNDDVVVEQNSDVNSVNNENITDYGKFEKEKKALESIADEGKFRKNNNYGGFNALSHLHPSDIMNFINPAETKEFTYPINKRQATIKNSAPVRDLAGLSNAMRRNMNLPAMDTGDAAQSQNMLTKLYNSGLAENNKLVIKNAENVNTQIDKRTAISNDNNESKVLVNNDFGTRLEKAAQETADNKSEAWKEEHERKNQTIGRITNSVARVGLDVYNNSLDSRLIDSYNAETAWNDKYKDSYDRAVELDDKVRMKEYMDQFKDKYKMDPLDFNRRRTKLISRKVTV